VPCGAGVASQACASCGTSFPFQVRRTKVTSVYPGGMQVDRAQAVLDEHVVVMATGRCGGCGAAAPCPEREDAARVFRHSVRLPRRIPGATRPELRRVGARSLLRVG
jgi:hypothetical protein